MPGQEVDEDAGDGREIHNTDQSPDQGAGGDAPTAPPTLPKAPDPRSSARARKGPPPGEQMSTRGSATIGAILIVALLAGLVAIGLMFKAADDAEQAVTAASAASATAATGARSTSGAPLTGSPSPAQSAPANSAVIGPWAAPRIPLIGIELTPNVSLLTLAATAGFVGAAVHTLTVLASRRGAHTLGRDYGLWYLATPVTGAALAILFFAAIHIGVLATGGAGDAGVNLYGVLVFGGLAGLFARKVSDKLAEVLGDVTAVAPKPDSTPDPANAQSPPTGGAFPKQPARTGATTPAGNGTSPPPSGGTAASNSRPSPA